MGAVGTTGTVTVTQSGGTTFSSTVDAGDGGYPDGHDGNDTV